MTWKSLLNGRERELVLDAIQDRETHLRQESLNVKRQMKDGNDPYARDLLDLATEYHTLYDRLRGEKEGTHDPK